MPQLPIISGQECIAALSKLGYRQVRVRGSHARLECTGRSPVTVPLHTELDRGTLRSILRTTQVSVEELLAILA